jgi:hypothetical protein
MFPLFSTKNRELSNFTMDKFFVPFVSVHIDHFPVKVQVESYSLSRICFEMMRQATMPSVEGLSLSCR